VTGARAGLALGLAVAVAFVACVRNTPPHPNDRLQKLNLVTNLWTQIRGWRHEAGLPLYRVDLAALTSKWIGETEKNLSQLLDAAEQGDVMLFFDEADSLFGARTDVGDAHDRYANSQTNFLLQRIEDYEGVAILATNSRDRFDPAFVRRFDMVLEFPLPAGTYYVRTLLEQPGRNAAGVVGRPDVNVPGGRDQLTMSDLLPG
jgi:SpoVK/Ycf46/Vps4 family AAA+-type ATPase